MGAAPILAGFDQGAKLTGWCVGHGHALPAAGAWRFDHIPTADVAALGRAYLDALGALHRRTGFTHAVFEASFVDRKNNTDLAMQRRHGIDMLLRVFCRDRGIPCEQRPFGQLKRALAGKPTASKDEMVEAALQLGLRLPHAFADGREDVADAMGAWLIAVGLFAPDLQPAWDSRVLSQVGALL